jgi:pilus assembly protein FimV
MLNKLKLSIYSVWLMLLSTQAHALGFGGLDVSSSLGEPLRAHVKLSDLSPDIGAECFKLVRSDSGSHFSANLQVEHGAENTGTLNIQSNKPIDDPIVNLTLVAGCNQDLSREYVLLLDPPTSSPEDTSQSLASPPPQQGNVNPTTQSAKKNGAQQNIQDEAASGADTPKPPKRKKKSKKSSAKQSPSSATSTDSASQSISVVTEPSSETSTSANNAGSNNEDARLYISNAAGAGAPLSLRLEKTLLMLR